MFKLEPLFLVCDDCGEAFSDTRVAYNHDCPNNTEDELHFSIKPESEAL
jgi:hypothetical protein